ncbi:GH25 family lysozyme [Liquorilactobacillus hordei]|uniref:GH25 family lysozyme n=1 Tax=Liquorilactobacillus hordei TaxID=468911 RepID=UPI0039E9ECA0
MTIENNGIETIIHDDHFTRYRLKDTSISKGINTADSFQFEILPNNPGYLLLQELTTYIEVLNTTNSNLVFKGRVLSIQNQLNSDGTFYKEVICESQMAFLNDSIQTYKKVQMKPYDFFKYLIDTHNAQVDVKRQFQLGNVTVTNSTNYLYCYVEDGLKTFDEIDADLLTNTDLGGELVIRNKNGIAYIDWTLDQNIKGKQEIKLNKNLISLYTKPNLSGILTVLYPFGATIESDSTDNSTDAASDVASPRLDISSVNSGKKYIESAELIGRYGRISGTKSWDDVKVASNLLAKAKAYLETFKPVTIGYELEAVDLFQLELAVDDFEVGNYYHVINQLEGIDDYFRIISISLDINNPLQSSLTIGDKAVSWAEFQNKIQQSNAIVSSLQVKAAQLEASTLTAQKKLNALQETVDSIPDDLQSVKDELQKQIDELKDSAWVSGSIFIDVSQYQSDTSVTWFKKCVNAGAKGVMIKLSDGSSGDENNALASIQLANSATAGLKLVGCYHYFENIANATAEANNFLAQLQANKIDKSKIVALDVEGNVLSNSKTDLDSAITTFLKVLTDAGHTNTCLYGSESRFGTSFDGSLAKFKWIADWDSSTKPDGAAGWQFSNDWQGYGVDASYSYSKEFI